jgi:hypothetical protein
MGTLANVLCSRGSSLEAICYRIVGSIPLELKRRGSTGKKREKIDKVLDMTPKMYKISLEA